MCCATVRDMTVSDPSLPCAQFTCPHVKWCTEVDAIDHIGLSYPPAYNGHIPALVFWFRPTQLPISLKDNPQSRWATILPLSNSDT
ncbi:hypothetical protein TNCV_3042211 [Trichonephila clavipes]|nr:hypothetical protein TNCV_3042211 [Trichonephila clavipes]